MTKTAAANITAGQNIAPLTWQGTPTCRPMIITEVEPLPEFKSIEFHGAEGSFVVADTATVAVFA